MKKTSLVFIITLLISYLNANSQTSLNSSISWLDAQYDDKNVKECSFLGISDGLYYSLVREKKETSIQVSNIESKVVETKVDFDLQYNGFDLTVISHSLFSDGIVLITVYSDKKTSKSCFLLHRYRNGRLEEPIEIGKCNLIPLSLENRSYLEVFTNLQLFSFQLKVSENGNNLLVQYPSENFISKYRILNSEMEISQERLFKIDFKKYAIGSYELMNNEMLEMLLFERNHEGNNDPSQRVYSIAKYNTIDETLVINEIDINETIEFVALKRLKDGTSILYGTYKGKDDKNPKGTFIQKLDENFQELFVSYFKFESEFANFDWLFTKNSNLNKGKLLEELGTTFYPSVTLHSIEIDQSGNLTLLAEQSVVHNVNNTNNMRDNMSSYIPHYYFGNILILRYSKDGTISWTNTLEKYQSSINDGFQFSSFSSFNNQDELVILLNRPTNEQSNSPQNMKAELDAELVIIDNNGKMEREILFNSREENKRMIPRYSHYSNEYILLFADVKGRLVHGVSAL